MAARYVKSENVVERRVRGSCILVPLAGEGARIDSLYTLNEMGAWIWERAAAGTPEERIAAGVVEEFDVDADTARGDVGRLLAQLVQIGALVPAPDGNRDHALP